MHKNLLLLPVFFLVFSGFSQVEEARSRVERLCSPEFHGRGYVNGGDSIAAYYLAAEFEKIGLEHFKSGYFQTFGFPVNTFPGKMEISVGENRLIPGVDFIVDPACPALHAELNLVRLSVPVILNEQQLIDTLVKYKEDRSIAYILEEGEYGKDTNKIIQQVSRELTAVAPVFYETEEKFTWSVAHTQLSNSLIQIKPGLLNATTVSVNVEANLIAKHKARNVIGYIPGKKHNKKLVFTAHYDHLGRMGEATYFPGANDNASGTAMLLTMAEHFSKNKPEYDICFIAFAGEEAGLIGSDFFVRNPLFKLDKIAFLINLDIMGSGEEGITVVNATVHPDQFNELKKLNSELDLLTVVKERGPAANSDHYWFSEAGVPAIFIYTMGPNKHYHDVDDTYEELSFAAYEQITRLLIRFTEVVKY